MTELHHQVRLALKGLLLPDLQDVVIEYIPIITIGFASGGLLSITDGAKVKARFIGTTQRIVYGHSASWMTKQFVIVHPLTANNLKGNRRSAFGALTNPEFDRVIDTRGLVFEKKKYHIIQIDPDLHKILKLVEFNTLEQLLLYDGTASPS